MFSHHFEQKGALLHFVGTYGSSTGRSYPLAAGAWFGSTYLPPIIANTFISSSNGSSNISNGVKYCIGEHNWVLKPAHKAGNVGSSGDPIGGKGGVPVPVRGAARRWHVVTGVVYGEGGGRLKYLAEQSCIKRG